MKTDLSLSIILKSAGLLMIALTALSSCRTLPEAPYPDILGWLPPESDILIRLNVPGNEELADMLISRAGLDVEDIPRIRERMAVLAIGLEIGNNGADPQDLSIHLATIGIWPKKLLGNALGKDWKRTSSPPRSWIGPDEYQLTALSGSELLFSRGKIGIMTDRASGLQSSSGPSGMEESLLGSDLTAWLTNTGIIMEGLSMPVATNPDGSPLVKLVTMALRRNPAGGYSLILDAYPSEERAVGGLAFALRLGLAARFGMSDDPMDRRILSEMTVEAGTGSIRIAFDSLDLEMIDRLLNDLKIFPEVDV